jgi:hypothetical protein
MRGGQLQDFVQMTLVARKRDVGSHMTNKKSVVVTGAPTGIG